MVNSSTIISAGLFAAPTALGGWVGHHFQEMLNVSANSVPDWTPAIAGAAAGAVLGCLLAGVHLAMEYDDYNPMPKIYKNLMTDTYRVVREYESSSGNFKVVRVLGKLDNRPAVLKMASLNGEPGLLSVRNAMLANEYRALSSMDSPHMVHTLGFLKGFRYFILILEHIEGPTLAEQLKEHGPLDFFQTLDFALAIARGLKDLHAKGYRFGHVIDWQHNIILHPERKAVFIDPSLADKLRVDKSRGPQDEMILWAHMVSEALGRKLDSNFLEVGGPYSIAIQEKVKDLQTILNRALERPGFSKYAHYDELIGELRTIGA